MPKFNQLDLYEIPHGRMILIIAVIEVIVWVWSEDEWLHEVVD